MGSFLFFFLFFFVMFLLEIPFACSFAKRRSLRRIKNRLGRGEEMNVVREKIFLTMGESEREGELLGGRRKGVGACFFRLKCIQCKCLTFILTGYDYSFFLFLNFLSCVFMFV
ncbi:hypothetical protein GGI42DRAFT_133441 [Trichoderma sp. SZMC 28013]